VVTLGIVIALLIGHALFPGHVRVDGFSITLILVAVVLSLAHILHFAKLPGGTEFRFRTKLGAGEKISQDVQVRIYQEGSSEPDAAWPPFVEVSGEARQRVMERPGDLVAEIRRGLIGGLREAARGLERKTKRMPPQAPEELLNYVLASGHLWDEQAGLVRVIWDLTNNTPLRGDVSPVDAQRILALADVLNDSFPLGYSLNFQPNEAWDEAGLICQYEHCIENMPLPPISLEEELTWRERIQKNLDEGFYDDHPSRKREFQEILAKPVVAEDHPEVVDRTGACPIFGHYCPGGVEVVESCEAAQEWIADIEREHEERAVHPAGDGPEELPPAEAR
jgi:hypothetical protein